MTGDGRLVGVSDVQSECTQSDALQSLPSNATSRSIGARIRAARAERGLGVRELARLADCSASLVSQVERGRANPSVSTLYALSDALNISVASLFEQPRPSEPGRGAPPGPASDPLTLAASASAEVDRGWARRDGEEAPARQGTTELERSTVLRRADRRLINLERGVHWELLIPQPERDIDFMEVCYAPAGGSSASEHAIRHHGRELGVVLEGVLSAQVGFEQYDLEPGDSLAFESTTPHRYWNGGLVPVRGIFVVLGAWPNR